MWNDIEAMQTWWRAKTSKKILRILKGPSGYLRYLSGFIVRSGGQGLLAYASLVV